MPTSYTQEIHDKAMDMARNNYNDDAISAVLDVPANTVYTWRKAAGVMSVADRLKSTRWGEFKPHKNYCMIEVDDHGHVLNQRIDPDQWGTSVNRCSVGGGTQ